MSGRKDFLSQPAPENYVAGLGRGATGFTTRSDLGPAREGPSEEQIKEALAKRAAALGAAPPTAYGAAGKKADDKDDDDDEDRYQDPENEVGLFASGNFDRDDDEADQIYQAVDEKMDRRRKTRREAREQNDREEYERNNPKIQQQFADLKRQLGGITDEEWAAIPEVGDLTGKNRRNRQNLRQRFYAVPDSVIAGARDSTQFDTSISADGGGASVAPNGSADAADGTMTNFAEIGAARDRVLQVRLDQAAQSGGSESVSGTATNIDPKGYLTSLQGVQRQEEEAQLGDVKRLRPLLESVIKTNPRHGPGWIAASRLEYHAGKIVAARNLIAKGCEMCPKNEDVWLENIRINDNHNAKIIVANAIKNNDKSVRLWIEAMQLESDQLAKKRILRKALDAIPQSVAVWKEAVNLEEDPADARLLLAKATEIIPLSVELWLALARLETPENAQVILNKARKAVPTSHEIWIAAARLQEQTGENDKVGKVMERAIKALAKQNAMLKREEWIAEAEKCEEEGAPVTCAAIIRETLGWDLDEDDDRRDTWTADAKSSINNGRYETARAMYAYALRVFYNKKSTWLAAADLERAHGTKEALLQILEKAVGACPHSEVLWLQLAREKWQTGDMDDARRVLGMAFQQNPNNQDIWLAAVKLEADHDQTDQARELLATARREAGTARVWIKSAAFERAHGSPAAALQLIDDGLRLYPAAAKLWMMKGQLAEARGDLAAARDIYLLGTKAVPSSTPLWLLASRANERLGATVKARSVLDRARLAAKKDARLWRESVRLERRAGDLASAKKIMAAALQQLPGSGLLWTESIMHLEPRTQRRPRALEAIKRVDSEQQALFCACARIFWADRRLDRAAAWFEKALLADPDDGDGWAWYWRFLRQHGTEEKRAEVLGKVAAAEPRHGDVWAAVAKRPVNARKGAEEVLKMVAEEIEKE